VFHLTHNGLTVMLGRVAADSETGAAWTDWLFRRSGQGELDFSYTTPVVVVSLVLSLILLRWFHRLPFERSEEERLEERIATRHGAAHDQPSRCRPG
jgi:hypothetical protein